MHCRQGHNHSPRCVATTILETFFFFIVCFLLLVNRSKMKSTNNILFCPGPPASVFLVTGCRGPHPYVSISASRFVSISVYSDSSLIRSKPIVHTVCMNIFVNGQRSMVHSFTVALLMFILALLFLPFT